VQGTGSRIACSYDAGCSTCTTDAECNDEPDGLCETGSCCPSGAYFYGRSSCDNTAVGGLAKGLGRKEQKNFEVFGLLSGKKSKTLMLSGVEKTYS
jgi:hypothetical protein